MPDFKFCPVCGGKLESKTINSHERLVCSQCGFILFQNPTPGTGIFIVEDGKVLLAKRAVEPFKGSWDSIGGFVENGEAPQEAAIRETKEETGLDIEITGVIGMGKGLYNDTHIITVAFEAKIIGGTPKAMDDVEELRWFTLSELPENVGFQSVRKALEALVRKYSNEGS